MERLKVHMGPGAMEEVRRLGREAYPSEACGIFLGRPESGSFQVVRVVGMDNPRKDRTHYEFHIEPQDILKVMKQGRQEGLDIVGFFHSHPDHPARPSEKDRAWAGETWPGVAQMILAVAQGEPGDARCYVYDLDEGTFGEVEVVG